MWLVYVLAFVLGGGVLLMQMLSGHHHAGADHGIDSSHPVDGPGLLSTRGLVFGLFGFGLVGSLLQIPGLAVPRVALAAALLGGLASDAVAVWAFRTLGSPAASGAADLSEAIGRRGRVIVACLRDKRGKVRVEIKGLSVDILAVTEERQLAVGADVVIVDVQDDVARVRSG